LLEKPLALAPTQAQLVVDAIRTAQVQAVMFFTRRFVPEIVDGLPGVLAGRPWANARAHFQTGAMLPGTPFADCVWRQEKGALWDLGPHVLSVLIPVLGPVTSVEASRDGRGMATLMLRHASGATSSIRVSFHCKPEDCAEFYEFTAGERRARIEVAPAPRQPSFAAALESLLEAIEHPAPGPHPCGVELGAEIVAVLAQAERTLPR
jgi:predicted dehydrogenase